MARVSPEHLAARRRQILEGAARCFSRDGFHGSSMQDILRETGLSAGAVYRYFPSKDAMIVALAQEVLSAVRESFQESAASDDPPPPDVLVLRGLHRAGQRLTASPSLVIQVWAETLRNPDLHAILTEGFNALLGYWTRIVSVYQRQGRMRADLEPEHVARYLVASAQGFLLQRALFGERGEVDEMVLRQGMRGLMSMSEPPTD
ncbi:TetR/AcrR family transcriptional regulator [Streptomyces profundus]|uniref:TetR/AcrR family transcriptional regulator n=1 Tax=Streptomyces profundus TaxID=2867410 RepID=UPI001D15FC93|nr:TetR/AcrR family transcriptional regulator [Streptomyces sp. MA3_2.13]UED85885.1 TetR/AcrR family transcriptional regulator [Streptomyces sp. MA3_2.13]